MQTHGIYGARVSKTHLAGEVAELIVSFKKEGPYRTIISIYEMVNLVAGELIIQYAVITPANYEVKASNWMFVTEMMTKTSVGKSIKGSGRFDTKTITEKFGANNHVLHITNDEGEMVWMIMVTDVNRKSSNALSKGIVFKNEAFFQGGGSLDDYDPRGLRFPVWFDNERILIRAPSLTKVEYLTRHDYGPAAGQELPDYYFDFYLARFKEPLSITEQFNVHLRGNNGYPLPADLFEEDTPDGIIHNGIAGTCESKGFLTKKIGETFFYFESHDGSVRATILKDPIKLAIKEIKSAIDDRMDSGLFTEFMNLVIEVLADDSKKNDAHHLNKLVDFYLIKLA